MDNIMIEKRLFQRRIKRRNHLRSNQAAPLDHQQNLDYRAGKDPGGEKGTFLESTRVPLYYSELLVRSLILYAEENSIFASLFTPLVETQVARLQKLYPSKAGEASSHFAFPAGLFDIEGAAALIMPDDVHNALRRTEWLLARLNEECLPGSARTVALFMAWANRAREMRPKESPKQIVVGVVVVAIPGITMGKFHRKKNMSILVRSDLLSAPTVHLADECTRTSFDVFQRAVLLARGDMKKLEPEIADWFWGGREFAFYEGSGAELAHIRNELVRLGIPHSASEENGMITALAISPIVPRSRITSDWNIKPLEA
jgi:hypothetical protein